MHDRQRVIYITNGEKSTMVESESEDPIKKITEGKKVYIWVQYTEKNTTHRGIMLNQQGVHFCLSNC